MGTSKKFVGIAAFLFCVFFINVLLGAFAGNNFLSDVGEAVVLFLSTCIFVAAMLTAEKAKS